MTYLRSGRRRGTARRRGAVTVEAALVLPMFLMFLFGIMEYGRYVMMLQVLTNAAREGARYAQIHTSQVTVGGTTYGNATSDVTNVVNTFLAGQSLSGQSVQVYLSDTVGNNVGTWTNADSGDSICVSITGNFKMIVPTLVRAPASIPVSIKSVMRTESN